MLPLRASSCSGRPTLRHRPATNGNRVLASIRPVIARQSANGAAVFEVGSAGTAPAIVSSIALEGFGFFCLAAL
jgi:hypothetical protein